MSFFSMMGGKAPSREAMFMNSSGGWGSPWGAQTRPKGWGPTEDYDQAFRDEREETRRFGGESMSSRQGFLDLLKGGGDVLKSYVDEAMPQFNTALQGIRENAIARGISTGDLGTSYEGDLASAFQKNLANRAASLYETRLGAAGRLAEGDADRYERGRMTWLDGISGRLDREQARQQARNQRRAGLLGSLIGSAGAVAGAVYGGGGK